MKAAPGKVDVGISTCFDVSLTLMEKLSLIKQAGFKIVELSSVDSECLCKNEERKKIKNTLMNEGILASSIHAPYEKQLSSLSEIERKEAILEVKKSIEAAAELGAGIVVIHAHEDSELITLRQIEEESRINMLKKSIEVLLKGIPSGINLALENGDSLKMLKEVADEFRMETFGFCFDTAHSGHKEITGIESVIFLEKLADRIINTHISDMNKKGVDHILPFDGVLNWRGLKDVFIKVNYTGPYILEVKMKISGYRNPALFLAEAKKRGEMFFHA